MQWYFIILVSLGITPFLFTFKIDNVHLDNRGNSSLEHYYKKSMSRYAQRFIQNIIESLSQSKQLSSYIKFLTDETLHINHWMQKYNKIKHSTWIGKVEENCTVIYPLGKFRRLGEERRYSKLIAKQRSDQSEYYDQIFIWKFSLYKYFRLNISFEYISITYNNLYNCYIGNVSVHSYSKNFRQNFTFCSFYSRMTNYPWYTHVDITLATRPYIRFDIKYLYSVKEPNVVVSNARNMHADFLVSVLFFVKINLFKKKLHVQVERIKFIDLYLYIKDDYLSDIYIYDGPDELSRKIQPKSNSFYETSAFQCILYISTHFNFQNLTLNYSSFMQNINKILYISKSTQTRYSLSIRDSFLIIKLVSETNRKLNISITEFVSSIKYNFLCQYGGILFYEKEVTRFVEKRSLCEDEGIYYQHRNIYSNNSNILLIMYAYNGHGAIYIALNTSTTKCTSTTLNQHVCAYNSRYKYNHKMYKKFERETQLERMDDTPVSSYILYMDYHWEEGCVIYQFTQDVSLFMYKLTIFVKKVDFCYIHIYTFIPKYTRTLSRKVSGFFAGKYFCVTTSWSHVLI